MNIKRIKYIFISSLLIWTLIITFLVIFEMIEVKRDTNELIKTEAQANFNKDQAIRHWAASHGGIYVPTDSITPASQYLSHIKDRDIETESGKKLTLMNPAYMIRQLNEYFTKYYGVVGHLTSLELLRPENKPDDWEKNALKQFENGITGVSGYDTINGEPYYRLIEPMKVTQNCLKCHAHQNAKVGDIRGSVAVSIPATPYYNRELAQKKQIVLIFGLLWLVVSVLIFFSHYNLKKQIKTKEKAEEQIRIQHIEIEKKNEQLKTFNYNLESKVKERTKELKESEEKYRLITENVSDIIWILNITKNKFTYVSPSEYKITGYTAKEAVQQSISEKLSTESAKRAEEEIKNEIQKFIKNPNKKSVLVNNFQQKHKDGSLIWIEISANFRYNSDNEIEIIGTSRNISARKKAEQSLIEIENQLSVSNKTAKLGHWEVNMDTIEITLSKEHQILINEEPVEVTMPLWEYNEKYAIVDDRHIIKERLEYAVKNRTDINYKDNFEYRSKTEFGTKYFSVNTFLKSNGIIFGITQDITSRKKAEQALKESEAKLRESNNTKDKFFSIIAHDLKSPFNAILGFSAILLEKHKKYDDKKREKLIVSVNNSANSAFKLLENLLTWSRSQSGAIKYLPEKLHLKILLFETISSLQGQADKKKIHILGEVSENELVFADKNMIATVLRNLISNAIKFTSKNGNIIISSKKQIESNFLKISIEDTGVGIAEDTVDNLFRIDKTVSTEGTESEIGTGLGLILCKEFIEKHGGKIGVESKESMGSTFSFSIPKG